VQLGYYCLQLSAMLEDPGRPLLPAHRASPTSAARAATIRCHCRPMPMASLRERTCSAIWLLCSNAFARKSSSRRTHSSTRIPITTPPPWRLIWRRKLARWQPEIALLYANHLHDNDRWPMGPAGCGIALPPALIPLPADALWSPTLSEAVQLDKAMALAMQHDLQGRLPVKKRLRRRIQQAAHRPFLAAHRRKRILSARLSAAMNCSGYVASTPECRRRRVTSETAHRLPFARISLQE
jgi:hypothetical protein